MTNLTLMVVGICLCSISISATGKATHYAGEYSQYPDNQYAYRATPYVARPTPYVARPTPYVARPTPYVARPTYQYTPRYPGYVYAPFPSGTRPGPQGPDGRGSRGDGAGRVGAGRDGAGRGGMGGRGGQDGGMGGRGGKDGGMGGRGGQDGRMGGRGGKDGGMGGRGGKDGGMGGRGGRDGGKAGRGGGVDRSKAPSNPADAIAFSGNRKTSQYFFQPGPVIFDKVTTNIGGGYNSDYGVFTAFESGIYFVSYNVVSLKKGAKNAAVDLMRNNKVINSASGSGSSGETSNSAVIFLHRYDQLSVQGRAESAIYCGDGGITYCSFNVALLKIGNFTDSKVGKPVPGW